MTGIGEPRLEEVSILRCGKGLSPVFRKKGSELNLPI